MENQEAYKRAKQRVAAKMGFYRHLTVYVAVCILLIIINFSISTQYLWVIWPVMGWGLAVLLHGLRVFVSPRESAITEEMIAREMEKED